MVPFFGIRIAFLLAMAMMSCLVAGVPSSDPDADVGGPTAKSASCLKFCAENEKKGTPTGKKDGSFEMRCGARKWTSSDVDTRCGSECEPACGEGDCKKDGHLVCPASPQAQDANKKKKEEEAKAAQKKKEEEQKYIILGTIGFLFIPILGLVIALRRKIRLCCMACRPRGRPITPAAGPPPEMGVPLNMAQSSDTVSPSVEQVGQPSGNEAAQPPEVLTSL